MIAHPPCQSGGPGAGRWPDHEEDDNEDDDHEEDDNEDDDHEEDDNEDDDHEEDDNEDDDHEKDDYDDRPLSRFAGEMMKSNTN